VPMQKIYTENLGPEAKQMKVLFGTPRHAYDSLRLKDVPVSWPEFYRVWRTGSCSKPVRHAIVHLLACWFHGVRALRSISDLSTWRLPDSDLKEARK